MERSGPAAPRIPFPSGLALFRRRLSVSCSWEGFLPRDDDDDDDDGASLLPRRRKVGSCCQGFEPPRRRVATKRGQGATCRGLEERPLLVQDERPCAQNPRGDDGVVWHLATE